MGSGNRDTPPPLLHSPVISDQTPSPITTPKLPSATINKSFKPSDSGKEKEHLYPYSWNVHLHKDLPTKHLNTSTLLDSDLESNDAEAYHPFPLFGSLGAMDGEVTTFESKKEGSISPRQSNLTAGLQTQRPSMSIAMDAQPSSGRHNSISMSGLTPTQYSGMAMPISTGKSIPRRESVAGSMMNGLSYGGFSMSSWIHDDIVMGSSPGLSAGFKSPSFHSSSYLPKLESSFMKDFFCCGIVLPSLHDLLAHYEQVHASQAPPITTGPPIASSSTTAPTASSNSTQQTANASQLNQMNAARQNYPVKPQFAPSDMEVLGDLEMDEALGNFDGTFGAAMPSSQFGTQNGQYSRNGLPPLDMSAIPPNPLQNFQGIRQTQHQSTPTTPIAGKSASLWGNNPTVSSVNTPTLSANPRHQQFKTTPDSSAPGTPGELDPELLGHLGSMSMNQPFGGFGNGDLGQLYIDNPAKQLFATNGGDNSNQTVHQRLGNLQYTADSDLAKRIREQQKKAGLGDTMNVAAGEEPKPFRCPVIGCEKAYKNQNGLKYHKSHGHNSQTLHENTDGTYSIVDPQTLNPYPGTMGMEKEKPYKCDHCGKRYKNLNGLKYHKQHSPPCNPELKAGMGMPVNVSAANANVAGAGLSTLGDEM